MPSCSSTCATVTFGFSHSQFHSMCDIKKIASGTTHLPMQSIAWSAQVCGRRRYLIRAVVEVLWYAVKGGRVSSKNWTCFCVTTLDIYCSIVARKRCHQVHPRKATFSKHILEILVVQNSRICCNSTIRWAYYERVLKLDHVDPNEAEMIRKYSRKTTILYSGNMEIVYLRIHRVLCDELMILCCARAQSNVRSQRGEEWL
jgi:hypothetical protein